MTHSREEGFSYEVVRGKRKKTDIVIERDGRVLIRVPEATPDERIREIVASKRPWIDRHLTEWRALNASRVVREFRNGESFLFLGRTHQLILATGQDEPLILEGEYFHLDYRLLEIGGEEEVKAAFRSFYTTEGSKRISERVATYAPRVGVEARCISVRELGHKWGTCSPKGEIAFHWKCIMAPLTIFDYVVVHELCHLHHLDHSPAFWNEVDKVLSDYRQRKEWLMMNGAGLDI